MRWLVAAILALALTGARADVVSQRPDAVSVTLYDGGTYGSLSGLSIWSSRYFGFISETRIVDLPAGRSTIRFRGVASSLVPESVRVEGLPGGSVERNFDYNLLGPGSLLERSIGRTVHVVRTDPKTGKETREDAVIRATSQGPILDAGGRIAALHCGGPPERLEFDEVPAGLTDAPTYAIAADVAAAGRYTIKLTYIAMGMGWSANYVAHIHPGGRTLDLAGWVTLANVSDTSFRDAPVDVVAGRLNDEGGGSAIWLDDSTRQPDCWPMDDWPHMLWLEALLRERMRGSQVGVYSSSPVTAVTNAFDARPLGDYKLYRLPERTTVAAHQTKQVRFVDRRDVAFERVYAAEVALDPEQAADADQPVVAEYRMRNDIKDGLGLPLPAGTMALLDGDGRFIGEQALPDDAPVGAPVVTDAGAALDVFAHLRLVESHKLGRGKDARTRDTFEITLRNAKPAVIPFMLYQELWSFPGARVVAEDRPHGMDRGLPMWRFDLAPGESASLRYTVEYGER
jgi:hypothetical protein